MDGSKFAVTIVKINPVGQQLWVENVFDEMQETHLQNHHCDLTDMVHCGHYDPVQLFRLLEWDRFWVHQL